jgi:hypothetical protein
VNIQFRFRGAKWMTVLDRADDLLVADISAKHPDTWLTLGESFSERALVFRGGSRRTPFYANHK